jgi:FKBP-type peptidyl-prolyl cis-trans isomerase FklB
MGLFDKLQQSKNEKINKEKEEGAAFLEKNKSAEGVQTLPSGIQYKILEEGNGPKPLLQDKIKAHYAGSLLNGKEFDSSFRRNQPFDARITQLIKGWQEVLPLMPVGSKWRLWIPSDLGYGDNGAPPNIPGGAVLQFDIQLIDILK